MDGVTIRMAPDRSVPITLAGEDYQLRFEQDDVEACETELAIGYIFFFRVEGNIPVYLSLRLCKSLLHHGLKTQNKRGDLEYVFPQTAAGARLAGDLIQRHMQAGAPLLGIWKTCRDAFELHWFGQPKDGETAEPAGADTKNLPVDG